MKIAYINTRMYPAMGRTTSAEIRTNQSAENLEIMRKVTGQNGHQIGNRDYFFVPDSFEKPEGIPPEDYTEEFLENGTDVSIEGELNNFKLCSLSVLTKETGEAIGVIRFYGNLGNFQIVRDFFTFTMESPPINFNKLKILK